MFTTKTYQKREFMTPYNNIVVAANQINMEATAFLGVIGWDQGVVHYELYPMAVTGN